MRMEKINPLFSQTYVVFIMLLVTAHAFLMNGHYHVHKQLTVGTYIDPINADADPSLFKNSIYVQAVKRTRVRFSISHAVHVFIIRHFDFETFAIILGIASLLFTLAGLFNLTQALFPGSHAGYISMLLYTAELNNWALGSPSPYLNFFHHSLIFAYPLIVWSLVYFFKKRFVASLFLAGMSWNFHPMCTAFVLWAYALTWVFHYKELRFAELGSAGIAFMIPILPTLMQGVNYLGTTHQPEVSTWLTTVLWSAWYSCFPSTWPAISFVRALLFFALVIIFIYSLPDEKRKRELLIFICSVLLLCFLGTLCVAIYPVPLIIKLSLWRSTLVYLLIALPCVAYGLLSLSVRSLPERFLGIVLLVFLTGYLKCFPLYYLPFFIGCVIFFKYRERLANRLPIVAACGLPVLLLAFFIIAAYHVLTGERSHRLILFFAGTFLFLLLFAKFEWRVRTLGYHIALILFVVVFDAGVLFVKGGPEIYYHGYFQGKRDPWADIQLFAQTYSDKDDLFIVPTYMNDFGIYSLRATLGDWAEGANTLYLDTQFAREWLSRMTDLGWKSFCFDSNAQGYFNLSTEDVVKTAQKYGAKFIITEKPKTFMLKKVYENDQFILYETGISEPIHSSPVIDYSG